MTALSALAPATAPETRPGPAGQRGCGGGATGCSLSRRRLERPHRRHGDHADRDAVLRRSRRAAPHRRLPRVPASRGQLRPSTEDHTVGKPRRDVGLLAPVLARHLGGRPDRSAGIGLLDLRAGGRYLLCSGGLSPVVDDRTHWNVLTLRPHQPKRRRMRRPSRGARASVSRLTPYRCAGPGMRGKPAPGSRYRPKMGARRSAAICGTAKRPVAPPPPPSCPIRRGVLAYHRRDNVPGQIRAQIRPPGPSAKITQGARPCNRNPPSNLSICDELT